MITIIKSNLPPKTHKKLPAGYYKTMLKGFKRSRLLPFVGLCACAVIAGLLLGGVIGAIASLGGCLIGAELALALVKWATSPHAEKHEKPAPFEPALLPVLISGEPHPDQQMHAAIFSLIASGRLSLDNKKGKLWVSDGDSGVHTGQCEEIVNLRIQGRLADGPQRLSSLPSYMTRAHGTCLQDIEKVSLRSEKQWSDSKAVKLRSALALVLLVAGFVLLALGISFGGLGIGVAAGLYWPTRRQLLKRNPYWVGQAEAWQRKIGQLEDRLPAPEVKSWGEALAISIATESQAIREQAEERMAISSDPQMKNLTNAALELSAS